MDDSDPRKPGTSNAKYPDEVTLNINNAVHAHSAESPDIVTGTAPGTPVRAETSEGTILDDMIEAHVIPAPERATHYSINDSPAPKDSIGFLPYIKALAKLFCHKDTQTPLVVGVFGKWGTGKTTFMRLLKDEVKLQGAKHKESPKSMVKQVWFNAWKYDVHSDLWAALLQAITSQVEGTTPLRKKLWRRFRRLNSLGFRGSLVLLLVLMAASICASIWLYFKMVYPTGPPSTTPNTGVPTASINTGSGFLSLLATALLPSGVAGVVLYFLGLLTPAVGLIRKIMSPLGLDIKELIHGKSLPDKVEGIMMFEKNLKSSLDDYLDPKGRLIVYIDDLDRCSPEHAVEVIEAVNLFLETDRCIFVLGMDHQLIASSIEVKYKDISERLKELQQGRFPEKENAEADDGVAQEGHCYGEVFLEKIVQIPISVPKMTSEEAINFASELVPKDKDVVSALQAASGAESTITDMPDGRQPPDLNISLSPETVKAILTLLLHVEANPRSIKRFYNMMSLVHFFYIANRDQLDEVNEVSLTMWFFLQYRFPQEIGKLRRSGESMDFDALMTGGDGKFPQIQQFFVRYSENMENAWVMERLSGQTASYYPITRFLAF